MLSPELLRQSEVLLQDMLQLDRPADACLSAFFRQHRPPPQMRSLMAESVYGVLRHWRWLSQFIVDDDSLAHTPRLLLLAWWLRVRGVSVRELAGVLSSQERLWASQLKQKKATENQAVIANLPDWLWQKILVQYGAERALCLARTLQTSASLDLRVNTLKTNRLAVLEALQHSGIPAEPTPYSPIGVRIPSRTALADHALFVSGQVEVQDEGSQLLSYVVQAKRGMMVADFCAGAGGKSLALGALMANSGRLYAFDVSAKRLQQFSKRLPRSGLSNVYAQSIAHERDAKLKRLRKKFDRVLVDAPCTGLGTLRRNPDLRWRCTEASVAELAEKQLAILASASELVKEGGYLIYATCSLLTDENEAVVTRFLAQYQYFCLSSVQAILSAQDIALPMGDYLILQPDEHHTDGFFAAVLQRQALPDKTLDEPPDKLTTHDG